MHFELGRWSRSNLTSNAKNNQNDNFGPKIVVYGHFEGVAWGNFNISKKHSFAPQYKKISQNGPKIKQAQICAQVAKVQGGLNKAQ